MSEAFLDTPFRPLAALRAAGRLLRDPEDTRQVFVVMTALRGRSGRRMFDRFRTSPVGARVLADRRRLLDRLQDRAALAALPDGSLGRAYLVFIAAEQLTADGLVEASEASSAGLTSDTTLFRDRLRDAHDLNHVVTGYGRDPLGELCLLAFMFRHTGNLGGVLIALMGVGKFARMGAGRMARKAVLEGFRHGGKARWLPEQDWEALLARPLEEVRRRLDIAAPAHYPALASQPSAS